MDCDSSIEPDHLERDLKPALKQYTCPPCKTRDPTTEIVPLPAEILHPEMDDAMTTESLPDALPDPITDLVDDAPNFQDIENFEIFKLKNGLSTYCL